MSLVLDMAKKKSGEPRKPKERRPVDLDLDLVPKIAMIAGALGMSVPSYVNARLQAVVDEELSRILKAMGLNKPKE